jgi:hypothetical protein
MPIQFPSTSTNALADEAQSYYGRLASFYNFATILFTTGDNMIYNNPAGTPQQVASTLGPTGQGVLQWQALLSATIAAVSGVPPASNSTTQQVTFNADGSITLVPSGNPLSTLGGLGGNQPV